MGKCGMRFDAPGHSPNAVDPVEHSRKKLLLVFLSDYPEQSRPAPIFDREQTGKI
jgi:hypothetical protein